MRNQLFQQAAGLTVQGREILPGNFKREKAEMEQWAGTSVNNAALKRQDNGEEYRLRLRRADAI